MNLRHSAIATLGLLAVVTAAGCTSGAAPEATDSFGKAEPSAWSAPCNLGIERDGSGAARRGAAWTAGYDEPTLAEQTDPGLYGEVIANDTCTDAQILRWQEARRQSGQSDAICRVIWSVEPNGSIRDLGCAVPEVVVWR
jgi:hypothetical protein